MPVKQGAEGGEREQRGCLKARDKAKRRCGNGLDMVARKGGGGRLGNEVQVPEGMGRQCWQVPAGREEGGIVDS
jgi:hypothetical protein